MLTTRSKQRGMTLVEIIIAMVIATLLTTGILSVFSSALTNSQNALLKSKLDGDLTAAMDMIVADVQRAGYWANATSSKTNIFQATGVDILATGSCFILAYDISNNVAAGGTVPDADKIGYALVSGAIQYRPTGSTFSCPPSGWTNLTNPNVITVTAFTPTLTTVTTDLDGTGSGTAQVNNRALSLTITGQLVNDTTITKTITRVIKVYNDKYTPT